MMFPEEPEAGEEVTISTTVTNTGIVAWSDKVVLKLDGKEIDSQDLFLKGGASETVTFTVTQEGSGTYTIEVGERSGTLKIGYRGFMLSAIIGGIEAFALIVGAIFFVWRSRKID